MKTTFAKLPLGAEFIREGTHYRKIALNMAHDDRCWSNIFSSEAEYEVETVPDTGGKEPGLPKHKCTCSLGFRKPKR